LKMIDALTKLKTISLRRKEIAEARLLQSMRALQQLDEDRQTLNQEISTADTSHDAQQMGLVNNSTIPNDYRSLPMRLVVQKLMHRRLKTALEIKLVQKQTETVTAQSLVEKCRQRQRASMSSLEKINTLWIKERSAAQITADTVDEDLAIELQSSLRQIKHA
jgi:hypothetical protein